MINIYLCMGSIIFGCGMLAFLTRRNLILKFLSLELMLFGVSLNFIAFGNLHNDLGGQIFTILILTFAASEAALALALIVTLYRSSGSLDIDIWRSLRESESADGEPHLDLLAAIDEGDPVSDDGRGDGPKLTPAGHDPLKFPAQIDSWHRDPAGLA